ncbi:MAG: hypothetical protein ACPGLV_18960, partial [Bacteroidia bacterium]
GTIPYVPINVQIDLNDPRYLDLNPYGGYLILPNQGHKGIVIYHQFDDTYVCYDMTCSYEPTNPCNQLEIDENGFLLQCGNTVNGEFEACCGSKFLWDGFPTAGPALYSLAQYVVYKNGNLLRVSN